MNVPVASIPPAIGTGLKLPTGELLLIPAELNAAIAQAWRSSIDEGETAEEWRTAFGAALVTTLHAEGLILVARARQTTRESVNADVYSLALSGKHETERLLERAAQILRPDPDFGSLFNHWAALDAALSGHAPPVVTQVLRYEFEHRLRRLREILFGQPYDQPLTDARPTIDPDKESAASIVAEGLGVLARSEP